MKFAMAIIDPTIDFEDEFDEESDDDLRLYVFVDPEDEETGLNFPIVIGEEEDFPYAIDDYETEERSAFMDEVEELAEKLNIEWEGSMENIVIFNIKDKNDAIDLVDAIVAKGHKLIK